MEESNEDPLASMLLNFTISSSQKNLLDQSPFAPPRPEDFLQDRLHEVSSPPSHGDQHLPPPAIDTSVNQRVLNRAVSESDDELEGFAPTFSELGLFQLHMPDEIDRAETSRAAECRLNDFEVSQRDPKRMKLSEPPSQTTSDAVLGLSADPQPNKETQFVLVDGDGGSRNKETRFVLVQQSRWRELPKSLGGKKKKVTFDVFDFEAMTECYKDDLHGIDLFEAAKAF